MKNLNMKEQYWLNLEAWALQQDNDDVEEHTTNTAYLEAEYFGKEPSYSTGAESACEEMKSLEMWTCEN